MKKALKTIKSKLKIPKSNSGCKLDESKSNREKDKVLTNAIKETENVDDQINSPELRDEEKNGFFENEIKVLKHKRFKIRDFREANFGNYAECVHKEKEYNFIKICRICCVPFTFTNQV